MATILFRWNPETDFFSRYELQDLYKRIPFVKLKWPIKDYQFASNNDTFYLIDETVTGGIVMKGIIKGNPFASTDNYSGELGYFCLLEIYEIMEPFHTPFISIDVLKETIPSFNWNEGDNGVILDTETADQIDILFNQLYHSERGSEWGEMISK